MRLSRVGIVVIGMLTLTACSGTGFYLRGLPGSPSAERPMAFKTVFLDLGSSKIAGALTQQLTARHDLTLSKTSQAAEAVIQVVSENYNKDVLSINRAGQTFSYLLSYKVTVAVYKNKQALGKPITVHTQQTLPYSDTLILGKAQEEGGLQQVMYNDAATLLMFRIVALRDPAPGDAPEPQDASAVEAP